MDMGQQIKQRTQLGPGTHERVVYTDLEGDDGFVDAGGEVKIEDDWVDLNVASPPPAPSKKQPASKGKGKGPTKAVNQNIQGNYLDIQHVCTTHISSTQTPSPVIRCFAPSTRW